MLRPALAALLLWAPIATAQPSRLPPAPPAQSAPLDLDTLARTLAAVPQRNGSFVEEKWFAALDRPLVGRGRLEYRRPNHLEKTTTEPTFERLLIDGDRLEISNGTAPPRSLQLSAEPMLKGLVATILGVLSGDLAALRPQYRVSAEGSAGAWRLTLQPVDPQLAQFVTVVRIDGSGPTPRVFETVQTNGDSQRLTVEPASGPAG